MAETKPQTLFAMNRSNLLVLDSPIVFQVQTHYDLEPEATWDDQCILWSVEDEGATYRQPIQLTNDQYVERDKHSITIRFEEVVTDCMYSCVIEQGDGKSIVLFQNLYITDDMAVES